MSFDEQKKGAPVSAGVCMLCHQRKTGCCTLTAVGEEGMFGLTSDEVAALSAASGLEPGEFTVRDVIGADFEAMLARINPIFGLTMPGRKRIRLKVTSRGGCVFLGPQGCTLPLEARPVYCRLYPFWFTPDERIMVLTSDTCLAQEGARTYKDVLKNLGENPERLRELFGRLKKMAARHAEEFK